ncbi:alpha/beta fold hydrolase [Litoribacter ruber]|uniref:Alpha/beta fold hydrolase n=1 Tax=Litoribacter ruber TaxID=702568 RepID=A0AAP2CH90_9BACT|nr:MULTISPECIES: alpha/beta fold hydrolase [Litoribacter]MBS9524698.1 alpha/beta fold hydrolase [Litoribacter alkaliphilus]MBT0812718.1 alpha/beta fold hydrolase [Litoribacter ruber]
MPLIENIDYLKPRFLFNGHLQTIVPSLFRKVNLLPFERERITTSDGDFLDLDWLRKGNRKLVIISHGLEGNSRRPYMQGMAHQFYTQGYDVLNWNFRGCSEEQNLRPIFYNSGATYDLDTVIAHAQKNYEEINLVGFSLGGNLILKYLGEERQRVTILNKAVAISVPLHLESSCIQISKGQNLIYSNKFLRTLKDKIIRKAASHPSDIDISLLKRVKTLKDFDDVYTGPLHGYDDAHDYYEKCSSLYFLEGIEIPTLILNAVNDPFLSPLCYPKELAQKLEKVYMEFPEQGGHVGFSPRSRGEIYWSEKRAFEFISSDE